MPSSTSVQAFATQRNGQVELFIDFLLNRFLESLAKQGKISAYSLPELQKRFSSDDCSDVFDHYFEMTPTGSSSPIQIWGQTTCYKGNELGTAESNKTYEIRETLIEALGLRRWLTANSLPFKTIHFTVGSTDYTYPWFMAAKNSAFDLSIYSGNQVGDNDIFAAIKNALHGVTTEFEALDRLGSAVESNGGLNTVFEKMLANLMVWFNDKMPASATADAQAELLTKLKNERQSILEKSLSASLLGGENIKGRALDLLQGKDDNDQILLLTLQQILAGKPFLKVAMQALENWNSWTKKFIPKPVSPSLRDYLKKLWAVDDECSLILRRLLIRMHVGDAVQYPADLYIQGISEHNLYSGHHQTTQVEQIVEKIYKRYCVLCIDGSEHLYELLTSSGGKKLLKESLRLESYNGAALKPSFLYIENALQQDFKFESFNDTALPPPTAYHAKFTEARVDPYNNMKVIVRRADQKPIAIIKAKYFRKQEFPRRAKEESYVGLTTKYDYDSGKFFERYPGIPLIMFVDMDVSLKPPPHAVTRLVTAGWDVFFSIEDLRKHLTHL